MFGNLRLSIARFVGLPLTAILLCAVGLLMPSQAKASHGMGADLSYQCLGGDTLLFTLSFYRDCGGIAAPTTATIDIVSASCGISTTLNLNQLAFFEVSPLCPSFINQSECNGGTFPGVELYVYQGTFVLPTDCPDWVFSYGLCCRNPDITTLSLPDTWDLYVQATYNSVLANQLGGCNSAPVFTTPPVPYICAGQVFNYNHGAIDSDGDSLVYTLVQPLDDAATPIPYNPPFNPTQPMATTGPFSFSSTTGQMTITPQGTQTAVVAIRVDEYRDGVLIGSTMRDMQVVVINCNNAAIQVAPPANIQPPSAVFFPDPSGPGGTFVVCPNTTFTFTQDATDPNAADIINMTSNISQAIPGAATLPQPGNPAQIAVLVPGVTQTTSFTITYNDGACPIPSNQVVGFTVYVPEVTIIAGDTLALCGGYDQNLQVAAQAQSLTPGTYSWTQLSGVPVNILNGNTPNATIQIPAAVLTPLQFVVQFTDAFCTVFDTLTVEFGTQPLAIIASANDSLLCGNNLPQAVELSADISANPPYYYGGNFSWTPAGVMDTATSQNPTASVVGNAPVTFTVTYTLGNCVGTDDVTVLFDQPILTITPPADTICAGDLVCLTANISSDTSFFFQDCDLYTVNSIPYNPVLPQTGTTVTLTDDALSGNLSIGFPFAFFCTDYTQFRISSNGFITFDLAGTANGCCSGGQIPAAPTPNNIIALAWNDLNPGNGGQIQYTTVGTAPNRRCIINFVSVPHFGAAATTVTGQIILYETSNWIDIISINVQNDGSNMTQGIENFDGTLGFGAPGRVASNWTAQSNAFRFRPFLISNPSGVTYNWPQFGILDTNQICVPLTVTTPIVVQAINPDGCAYGQIATISVGGDLSAPQFSACTPNVGQVTFNWLPVAGAVGYEVSLDLGATWINNGNTTSYTVTGLGNNECFRLTVRAVAPVNVCGTFANFFDCCALNCLNPSVVPTPPTCNGGANGTAAIEAGGNSLAPVSFEIVGGATVVSPTTGTTLTGLTPGRYDVVITDAQGCFDTITFNITNPPAIVTSTSTVDEICDNNGSATVVASGGAGGFTYLWNNGQTTATATGLDAQIYTVTVTDANACTVTATATVVFDGPDLQIVPATDTVCPGEPIQLLAIMTSSGTASGCGPSGLQCNQSPSVLEINSGTDTLGTLDGTPYNGFFEGGRVQMLFTAAEMLNAGLQRGLLTGLGFEVLNKQNTTGYNGFTISLRCTNQTELTGFVGPAGFTTVFSDSVYTSPGWNLHNFTTLYDWDGVSNLVVQVCFTNNTFSLSDWVSGGATPFVSTAQAENDNASGCTLAVDRLLSVRPNVQFSNCTTVDYTWSPATGLNDPNVANPIASPLVTTTYSVTADDGVCPQTGTVTIVVEGGLTAPVQLPCSNITYNGLTFNWEPVAGATAFEVSLDGNTWTPANGANGLSHVLNGLVSGQTITLFVRAAGGTAFCPNTVSQFACTTALCAQPTAQASAETCFGQANGFVLVTGDGTGPFVFDLIQNGSVLASDTAATIVTFNNLAQGQYEVQVTDQTTLCIGSALFTIGGPAAPISLVATSTPVSCFGGNNGTATATANGGNGGFTYNWNPGGAGQSISSLVGGSYSVTATDANGCSASATVTVNAPAQPISVTIASNGPSCNGGNNGQAFANTANGQGALTWNWSDGQTTVIAQNLPAGPIGVTVTDGNGCTASATGTIQQPTPLVAAMIDTVNTCIGGSIGQLTADGSGGTPGYNYTWSNGQAGATATGLGTGSYSVTVTDANGCTGSVAGSIAEFQVLALQVLSDEPCAGAADGTLSANVSGGTGAYSYSWSNGQQDPTASGLIGGTYSVTVNDSNGCSVETNAILNEIALPIVNIHLNGVATDTFDLTAAAIYNITAAASQAANTSYQWIFANPLTVADPSVFQTTVNSNSTGIYTLAATANFNGCVSTDQVTLIFDNPALVIPNSFTPNSDERNDDFYPLVSGDIEILEFRIYNRWGNEVYSNKDLPWDGIYKGEPAPRDAYIYVVVYLDGDLPQPVTLTGDVTLIR